jgi:hypothetical protein
MRATCRFGGRGGFGAAAGLPARSGGREAFGSRRADRVVCVVLVESVDRCVVLGGWGRPPLRRFIGILPV